jgi:hypothetical protein
MNVIPLIRESDSTVDRLIVLIAKLEGENEKLKTFSRIVIAEALDGHDVEGFDIIDVAERHELLVMDEATEDDVAAGIDCEVGDAIPRFADWM